MEITRGQWERYEFVRQSGRFNMVMNARDAAAMAGLSQAVYWEVAKRYEELARRFTDTHEARP